VVSLKIQVFCNVAPFRLVGNYPCCEGSLCLYC